MTNYYQLRIDINNCDETKTDLLAAFLADIGYDSFVADESGMSAYIISSNYDENTLKNLLTNFPIPLDYKYEPIYIEGKDWNEEWEKNYFKPIIIENECVIHSTFHKDIPQAKYDITIDPKMAFGTGHHSTTSLILKYLLSMDLVNKSIIDMGTGTGILAILCSMKGAKSSIGIEIDSGAYENALENVLLNKTNTTIILGDAERLSELDSADVFIANINRNIILSDIRKYRTKIKNGGTLILSGFYESDIDLISKSAQRLDLYIVDYKIDNNWVAVRLTTK